MFALNGVSYALKENIVGDAVIQAIDCEAKIEAIEQIGTSIPYPVIKSIIDIAPENVTMFIINNADIVTVTNGNINYWQIEKDTELFSAFPLVTSLRDDYRDLILAIDDIVHSYLLVLCDEAIRNVELISESIRMRSASLARRRRPKLAMFSHKRFLHLTWAQQKIQALADDIIQSDSYVNKSQR